MSLAIGWRAVIDFFYKSGRDGDLRLRRFRVMCEFVAQPNTVETEFDVSGTDVLPQVDIVYGYVDMNGIAVEAFVAAGTKAIIFAGTGEGTVANSGIEPALIEARKKGVVVVRSSRVGNGLVTRSAENRDDEFGFVVADTLSPQKARILAMLALSRTHLYPSYQQTQRPFSHSIQSSLIGHRHINCVAKFFPMSDQS